MKKFLKKTYNLFIKINRSIGNLIPMTSFEKKTLLSIYKSFPKVMTCSETIDEIIKNHKSLARFGDAEFDIALALNKDDPYQKPSAILTERLIKILSADSSDKIIVAIPPFKVFSEKKFYKSLTFWEWYWLNRYILLAKFLNFHTIYGNSLVSRTEAFYEVDIQKYKKIWDNKKVVFVRGKYSRFILDQRLFENILAYEEIFVPATSAFDEYDRILSQAKEYPIDTLFLIAAGPTATVLAYDLSLLGYQAIDIGHITNCYAEFLGESGAPESTLMVDITREVAEKMNDNLNIKD